ncbi:arylamine N-acetyltransferase, pineal gland isozyme NAT-3-like [Brienomyrus brachyistius]|uniref:arylamine N-acetyltransferase, pineal gland isozyme NAT-3-like n=1 Tax=Brienomyrus brachyistius TaxID=42636 RepID=UPI0020B37DAC|nr:arylamine N-acetyltransferase, pineal gland isozyme NAT-3-like [Brienomyrus brachyistius]XP_048832449.1 arylamine N-acetyltransferase, pineal gland isozyme NAT-3-like [Brienomyrus brachyistius]
MDTEKYLLRIGFDGPATPTLETLNRIHRRHLLSVPFENLTIHSGGWVDLELQCLYDKIVNQRRGGFCYENNGLFSWLLSQLGFKITVLSAQVKNRITRVYGPPFDHLIVMVMLEGQRWLCDVGFGAGFEIPISLETEDSQKQEHGVFRVRCEGETMFLETVEEDQTEGKSKEEGWTGLYKFTLQPREREDFLAMCLYHQTSPSSIFYCKSLCSLLLPNGRVTYMGHKLTVTSFPSEVGGPISKTTLKISDKEIPELLRETFGMVLPSPIIPKDEVIIPPASIY